jgi:hypothetical protein
VRSSGAGDEEAMKSWAFQVHAQLAGRELLHGRIGIWMRTIAFASMLAPLSTRRWTAASRRATGAWSLHAALCSAVSPCALHEAGGWNRQGGAVEMRAWAAALLHARTCV